MSQPISCSLHQRPVFDSPAPPYFIKLTVRGMELLVSHQTSWLESTGEGVPVDDDLPARHADQPKNQLSDVLLMLTKQAQNPGSMQLVVTDIVYMTAYLRR